MPETIRPRRDAIPWIVFGLAVMGGISALLASDAFGLKIPAAILAFSVALGSATIGVVSSRRNSSATVKKIRRDEFVTGPRGQVLLAKDATLPDLGVHKPLAEVPYVLRGIEDKARLSLNHHEPVLVIGQPLSGKSRVAAELVRTDPRLREMPILIPTDPKGVHNLLAEDPHLNGHIVFFPQFEETLASGGLTSNDVQRLKKTGNLLVATLEYKMYEELSGGEKVGFDARRMFDAFAVIELHQDTRTAREALAEGMPDPVKEGVIEFGLGEYLAGGGIAERLFHEARDAHPFAYALMRAAGDWRHSRIAEAIPKSIALTLAHRYSDLLELAPSNEPIEDQVTWAEEWLPNSEQKVFQLLQPTDDIAGDAWRPFELLASLNDSVTKVREIPDFTWDAIAEAPAPIDRVISAGIVAEFSLSALSNEGAIVRRFAQRAAEAEGGDPELAAAYGYLLAQRGDPAAEVLFRGFAEAGHADAMDALGFLLHERGDAAAENWFQRSAEAGSPQGMYNYGVILQKRGDPAAEDWIKRSAKAGSDVGMYNYGVILQQRGDPAAEDWIKRSAEAGSPYGMYDFALLLDKRDDPAAEDWIKRSAEAGSPEGMYVYALLLHDRDDPAAEGWFWRAIDAGNPDAEDWFRRSAEAGNPRSMYNYGLILEMRGDPDAANWFSRATESNDW